MAITYTWEINGTACKRDVADGYFTIHNIPDGTSSLTFKNTDISDDNDIEQAIREEADTVYHPVGTCKMGNDEMAVVDNTLKVYGIDGLRVVDASIMPTLIGGNTNAPTIMIGEKASDMILSDWN